MNLAVVSRHPNQLSARDFDLFACNSQVLYTAIGFRRTNSLQLEAARLLIKLRFCGKAVFDLFALKSDRLRTAAVLRNQRILIV